MGWKVKRRERYALIEVDEVNPRVHRGTFHIGPRHVKHHASKEFVEHAYVENPDFASEKDCRVFAQCSNIAVEVYDFYNKLFDPDYETVSVYDERFEVQYLFKEKPSETWRSVDYYNPRIEAILLDDGVDIKKVFDTDYGAETLEITYTVKTGARLKHTIDFTNKTAQQRTFRVVMKLAGITSDKVKHGQVEERITEEKHVVAPFVFFGEDNQHLRLSEYLWSLGEIDEETMEWSPTTLKNIVLNVHAQGCKADIIIGNYTLTENEGLLIDPVSDTFTVGATNDDVFLKRVVQQWNLSTYAQACGDYENGIHDYEGGMRWTVDIPQGSTINSAYLKLVAISLYNQYPTTIIEGEDVDDPATFSTFVNYDGRDRTSQSVEWTPIAWVFGTTYTSPDIKTIIQAIVNRPGFGTHIAIFWSHELGWGGVENLIFAASYDHETEDPPKLEVTWTEPIVHYQTITDILGMVDSSLPMRGFHLTASDQLGLLDFAMPRADFKQNIIDQLGMLDAIAAAGALYQIIIESLGMIDAVAPRADFKIETIESLGLLDTVTGRSALKQAITEILGLLETTAMRSDRKQALIEQLGMLDSVIKKAELHLTATDKLGMADSVATRSDLKQTITEVLGLLDSVVSSILVRIVKGTVKLLFAAKERILRLGRKETKIR